MPGIIGGIGGAVSSGLAGSMAYGETIGNVFPERLPAEEGGSGRSAARQAEMQLAALMITVLFAFVGGGFAGYVVKKPIFNPPKALFNDSDNWELPPAGGEGETHKSC